MAFIELENMEFYAYHGCFQEETKIGTNFLVNIRFELNTEKAQYSDNLADTINYLEVYQLTKAEMQKPSKLVEHVANRIADTLLNKYVDMQRIEVKVSKLNPPLGGKLQAVTVTIQKSR